jgi:pyruvate,water dikinase
MATLARPDIALAPAQIAAKRELVVRLADVAASDAQLVGGKNASLGEMIRGLSDAGIKVPDGFATTTWAYWAFIDANDLRSRIRTRLAEHARGEITLQVAAGAIRQAILRGLCPSAVAKAIVGGYRELCDRAGKMDVDVAVRSSATTEDLPDASFAGQQDTFLNVRGEAELLHVWRRCIASLFTDRAVAYRESHGFDHLDAALSVGVQRMVRSDIGSAGVMFSIEPETGFPHAVLINANWGLGESVVQGSVDPDEFMVFKPLLAARSHKPIIHKARGRKEHKIVYGAGSEPATRTVDTSAAERSAFVLTDDEVLELARCAATVERHYDRPMDIEWAKDGETGELYLVQARPETVQSRRSDSAMTSYTLKSAGKQLASGIAIGQGIATGRICRLESPAQIDRFVDGGILVTEMTDPDWMPIMTRASAIVTDHGGRTSHAAIVSRELGLTAVVGTGNATAVLADGSEATVSCAEGDEGHVYEGIAQFDRQDVSLLDTPETRTRVMLNIGDPSAAMRWWRLPSDGVGLARMEFIIGTMIKVHPLALAHYDQLQDADARRQIDELTRGYVDKTDFFVDTLARGVARIAASQYPNPVIVRMSDFKTNEYAELIGGRQFEPAEANPMLGWRGASRYYSPAYRDGFALECRAIRKAREELGFTNVLIMIPFCRTLDEADKTMAELARNGLVRGDAGLQVYVMCEVPSNVILAEKFAERFDGFSIGSNDLTQLTLGVDRDSGPLAPLFHEHDEAVTTMITTAIGSAHRAGRPIGLCGQAPSDNPQFAEFLVRSGIDSMSVTPDSFVRVKQHVAAAESRQESAERR